MMMYSFSFGRRLRRSTLLLLLLLAVMAAGRAVLLMLPGSDAAVSASNIRRQPGKTEEQRQACLAALGWSADPEPCEVLEVIIPKEFDETYQNYNKIQTDQGLDLTRYRGKRCRRYSYMVHNHPSGDEHVRLNLLVCSGKIIGGDVCSMGLDGFLQGLAFPASAPPAETQSAAPAS